MFNEKQLGLFNFIKNNLKSSSEEELKELRNGLMTLSHIVQATNPEMRPWAK